MYKPIAVFDTGIGSYSIVEKIRQKFDKKDIIYLADRASFPYGSKSKTELFRVVSSAIKFLEESFSPQEIILASNAPSVTILASIKNIFITPIIGIFPPIRLAEEVSKTGLVGILGVKSMIQSKEIDKYIISISTNPKYIYKFNASPIVELVESGMFLTKPQTTSEKIRIFMDNIIHNHPQIDTFTLSSTHLPWLSRYFQDLYPELSFLDPADSLINSLKIDNIGNGFIKGLVTVSDGYSFEDFNIILSNLGIKIPKEEVIIPQIHRQLKSAT